MSDLTAVSVLAVCSLIAAVVLFKLLRSTAVIKKKEYQVGGAAAGFLVIYGTLYGSYAHLESAPLQACQASLAETNKQLQAADNEFSIKGTVSPALEDATIVLTVKQTNPDSDGRFLLQKRGVDPTRDPVALYIVTESKYYKKQVFPGDDISNLQINLEGK